MKSIILTFLLLVNIAAYSNNNSPVNGCGPAMGNLYKLAPDKIELLGIDFTSACNLHDLCYGNNIIAYVKDEDGLYRSQFETNSEQRTYCDDTFKDSMKEQCSILPLTEKTLCHSLAFSYFATVMLSGWLPFTKDPNVKEPLSFGIPFRLKRLKQDFEEWLPKETSSSKNPLSKWFPKETTSSYQTSSDWLNFIKPKHDSGWGAALDKMPVE